MYTVNVDFYEDGFKRSGLPIGTIYNTQYYTFDTKKEALEFVREFSKGGMTLSENGDISLDGDTMKITI